MCETTFENARPGDRVWSILLGWGNFRRHADTEYPVIIDFPEGNCQQFTMDGRHLKKENRSLFWDEIKITPPPRPKRKVKKEVKAWMNIYNDKKLTHPSQFDADRFASNDRIACVELTGSYEIEE